ncbi:hypothetical protein [Bdellovibrio sp. HCB209]|uniref:hypothetical protein n=1 Tax=Bdellovibrio sp. HCB209 TaxID=3394354 RepID=UPI0039B64B0C
MKKKALLLTLLATILTSNAQADEHGVWFEIPVYDYPFNNSDDNPPDWFSMRQSMSLSTSYIQTVHRVLGGDNTHEEGLWWRYGLMAAYDFATMTYPIGPGWAHEEWHRAVMTRHQISSFNEMNAWPTGSAVVAVDHVSDDALIALKRDHPADQVRLSSAGMEAQVYQNLKVEESHFFRDARSRDETLLWLNALNVTSYMLQCAGPDADTTTDDEMAEEGANVKIRDFTGLDCTAWVYDLFRPDEAYTARGTHPSGVGIKRYIKWSDLNGQEQDFLSLQSKLSYLNFLDPFLLGIKDFRTSWGRINAKTSHYLTSFGGNIDLHVFLDIHNSKWLVTLHNGMTNKRYFPGLTVKWVAAEIADSLHMTLSGTGWAQPKDQRFDATETDMLVDGAVEFTYRGHNRVEYFVGYEVKTPGFVAGNVYLDSNWSAYTGFRVGMF